MRIESIADHLGPVETIAEWHWGEWGHADPAGSLATWTDGLRERTTWQRIPTTYVALDGEELLGSVTSSSTTWPAAATCRRGWPDFWLRLDFAGEGWAPLSSDTP